MKFTKFFVILFLSAFMAGALHAADDAASDASFERLTIVTANFQEQGEFVSFTLNLKNTGTVNFDGANASANLGGEKAEPQFFDLPQGAAREIVFSFSKPSIPGVYKGMIIVMAGRNELRQPIELTVEPPAITSAPTSLEQYLIPALVVLALLAIALVLLARRRTKKPVEPLKQEAHAIKAREEVTKRNKENA